jgi:thiosulfate/3-mercaptopyruvate sulfurtransferase
MSRRRGSRASNDPGRFTDNGTMILITTEELAKHLDDPAWVVIDTRHDLMDPDKGPKAYAAGHIPSAFFMHTDTDLAGKKTGKNGRHPLPPLDEFAAKLNERGVAPGTQVVIYDDLSGNFAVRLWWMLRWLGHDKAALLDGGFPKWAKEGRPITAEVPAPRKGSFVPRPHLGDVVDTHFVNRFHETPTMTLVDGRSPARFQGLEEPVDPVAGHIPGAVNRFWKENLNPDGTFKPPEQLRAEFTELLGTSDAGRVVHMCGSGVTACHNLFAMELAGLPPGRLYPGSWSEWVSDPARPIAGKT